MDKKVKKLWLKALRSGEYKQGKGRLRQQQGGKTLFCCLGVLCNLHAQAHPVFAATQPDPNTYDGHDAFLPPVVREWAGISDCGSFSTKNINCSLTELNDSGRSFKQIANTIEKYF